MSLAIISRYDNQTALTYDIDSGKIFLEKFKNIGEQKWTIKNISSPFFSGCFEIITFKTIGGLRVYQGLTHS